MSLPLILRVFKNGQIQEVKQFHLEQIVIGNNAEVELDLNDSQVSPIHAMIEKRDERFFVCDLGSESGTFKNGVQILDAPIDSGDEIQVGSFKLHFSVGVPRPKAKAPGGESTLSGISHVVHPNLPGQTIQTSEEVSKSDSHSEIKPTQSVTNESHSNVSKKDPYQVSFKDTSVEKNSKQKNKNIITNNENKSSQQKDHVKNKTSETQIKNPSFVGMKKPFVEQTIGLAKPNLESGNQIIKGNFEESEKTILLNSYELILNKKTFAPLSAQMDINKVVKPSRGTVLEITIAWKERIIETYHFLSTVSQVTIGNDEKSQIQLPASVLKGDFKIIDSLSSSGATVNVRPEMSGDLITNAGVISLADLDKTSRLIRRGIQSQIKIDQGEVLRLTLNDGQLNLYIRFVPQTSKPVLMPFVPLTIGEIASVLISVALVGLLGLYISINVPIEQEQNKHDEQLRMAQIIFQKPKLPQAELPPNQKPPPPPVEPPPPPKKAVLSDKTQSGNVGGSAIKTNDNLVKKENHVAAGKNSPGQAADVRPNNNVNKPKKFTSSKQGGSVKLGAEAGSNASTQKPVDVKQLGLASALTGGGMRTRLDQAVSGAGGIIGDSSKSTGSSGFSKSRSGDDFGSAFKEVGAGGKGVATEGISGGITKGRSTGTGTYGSDGSGLGNHRGIEVSSPGSGVFDGGKIDKEGVRRVIKSKHDVIARCYEKELRFKAQLSGKIVLSFVLDDQGRANKVEIKSSDIGDSNVETCIVNEFQTWRFPEAPKGETALVSYPFVFTKQN